jgi:hypothetical protein
MTAREQHPDLIDGLDDLRPGDIMLGPIGGLVPGLFPVGAGQLMLGEIFRAGGLSVRHAGIVVEEDFRAGLHHVSPRIVEAMPSGARERRLTADDWTRRHAYVRLPEDYRGQAADAAAIARAMVGTPYSFASYGALAAWRFGIRPRRLEKWIDRRTDPVYIPGPEFAGEYREPRLPREAICSVLVDQAWTLAGKQVMPHGTRPQVVTPGALAGRLLRLPDTRWGFPE